MRVMPIHSNNEAETNENIIGRQKSPKYGLKENNLVRNSE